jgi:aspartate racemase
MLNRELSKEARVKKELLGIVGGLGPLASAEFLKTIYEVALQDNRYEQDAPAILMLSDPTFPDRTEAFINKKEEAILHQFIHALESLHYQGATRIIVCCITLHYLLDRIPPYLRRIIVSLVDLVFEKIEKVKRSHLLFCTEGTRRCKIFQNHHQWATYKDDIILLSDEDQHEVHQHIYAVKKGGTQNGLVVYIKSLLQKYRVSDFIVGCTEGHLVAKFFDSTSSGNKFGCIDPLTIIAHKLAQGEL